MQGSVRRAIRRRLSVVVTILLVIGLTAGPIPAAGAATFTPNPRPHTVVVDWIEAMLQAIELNPPAPTATTWRMSAVVSSMYDAFAAYDRTAVGTATGFDLKRPKREQTDANRAAAISYAAHKALKTVFPNQSAIFDEVLALQGLSPSSSTDPKTPAGIGNLAAAAVLAQRYADGSNAANGFVDIANSMYGGLYQPANSADPSASNSLFGPTYSPNRWTPLRVPNGTLLDGSGNPLVDNGNPSTYSDQKFLTPHWGSVDGFALTSGAQFRPPAPPQLGSSAPYTDALGNVTTNDQAFRNQTTAVLMYSGALTDTEKVIAEFWADGPHTWTPPGHWVQIAIGVSLRDNHTISQDVEMFMALTNAVLDAGIVAWDAKRVYDFVRPASAIPYLFAGQTVLAWGGPNQGSQLIDGADWRPYQSLTFVTPAFAEFVSGHSTFSRASAEVLTAFTGSGAMYDGVTMLGRDYDGDGVEDVFGRHIAVPGTLAFESGPASTVVLTWDTFLEAADEAGISRRYGGIHFQDGDLRAREMGRQVGQQAYALAKLLWDPFGGLRTTVGEQASAGNISNSVRSTLLGRIKSISTLFSVGNVTAGCTQLDRLATYVDGREGRGISSGAHDLLAGQIAAVDERACD